MERVTPSATKMEDSPTPTQSGEPQHSSATGSTSTDLEVRPDRRRSKLGRASRNVKWIILVAIAAIVVATPQSLTPSSPKAKWESAFSDDFLTSVPAGQFPGAAYSPRWTSYDGFADTSGHGTYSADALSVHDGVLDMYLRTQDGRPVSAAPVPLVDGHWGGQIYGRYEVRFRSDALPGFKMAFLLWPDSNNWAEGEIDFPEVGSLAPGNALYANMYETGDAGARIPGPSVGFSSSTVPVGTAWHTAIIEWLPDEVTFILDGVSIGSITEGVPDTPMHWVLQTETAIDSVSPNPAVAGHIQIDRVHVDRYAP